MANPQVINKEEVVSKAKELLTQLDNVTPEINTAHRAFATPETQAQVEKASALRDKLVKIITTYGGTA